MFKTKINKKGFSLLEIILVVAFVTMAINLAVPFYRSAQLKADINTQVSSLVAHMRMLQSNASTGLDSGAAQGIHLDPDSYTVFSGSFFNELSPTNYKVDFSSTMIIQNINLLGSGNDIIFTAPYGDSITNGSFEIASPEINKTFKISISEIGTINFQNV